MGGSCAVTIREPNGAEHRMCRWTNTMPWGLANSKMVSVEPDPAHLAAYLHEWERMRADWLKNKDTGGGFEYNMTECYAPYPFLAPMEYGLVLVDFKSFTIISKQGYTSLNRIDAVTIGGEGIFSLKGAMAARRKGVKTALESSTDSTINRIHEWWQSRRICAVGLYAGGKVKNESHLLNLHSFEDFVLSLTFDHTILLDMSPFQFIDSNDKTWREVLGMVKGIGFDLSEEEQSMWAERITQEEEE